MSLQQKSDSCIFGHSQAVLSTSSIFWNMPGWDKYISMLGEYVKKYAWVE
jgi:hypothetical protein